MLDDIGVFPLSDFFEKDEYLELQRRLIFIQEHKTKLKDLIAEVISVGDSGFAIYNFNDYSSREMTFSQLFKFVFSDQTPEWGITQLSVTNFRFLVGRLYSALTNLDGIQREYNKLLRDLTWEELANS